MGAKHCRWDAVGVQRVISRVSHGFRRVLRTYSFWDRRQEAFLVYRRVRKRYAQRVESSREFRTLFQRAIINHFRNLLRADSRWGRGCATNRHAACMAFHATDAVPLVYAVSDEHCDVAVGAVCAKLGLISSHRGRSYLTRRRRAGESRFEYLRRLAGSDESAEVVLWWATQGCQKTMAKLKGVK